MTDEPDGRVSGRETELLELVAEGLSNSEIARRLWVTEGTVKFHLTRVYKKLGVSNRTAAAMWWRDESAPVAQEPRE